MKILFTAGYLLVFIAIMPDILAQGKLEIIVVPPSRPLNWDNPTSLQFSFLRTYTQRMIAEKLYRRERTSMGHGIVRAKCYDGTQEVDFWSGFNGNQNNNALHLSKAGAGLSVFLYDYYDGYIQSTEFIHKYLNDALKQPGIKPSFVRILVNQEQCRLIKQHYEDFTNKDTLIYGFMTNPIDAGGAGCTSYVVSYAQKAGIFPPFLDKQWNRPIRISTKLLGPTDQSAEIDGVVLQPISMFCFINPLRPVKWNSKDDIAVNFDFLDPQYMVDFMRKSIKCLDNPSDCNDRSDIMEWLTENKARISTNEYMQGIEISLE